MHSSCCGWLASSLIIACLRELKHAPLVIPLEISWYHLNFNDLFSFGCCLLSRPISWFSSTKYLKCSLDYHFDFSHPSLGWSDLSPKNHPWCSLEITWKKITWSTWRILFDWSILLNLIWWITLNPSLSHFLSTCLSPFLSTKWFPIVTRT